MKFLDQAKIYIRSGDGGKGLVGDGKVFVIPLENVVRVSDGVQGSEAI